MNSEATLFKSISIPLFTLLVFLFIFFINYPTAIEDEKLKSSNIAPIGKVFVDNENDKSLVVKAVRSGEQVYNKFCFVCHATGISNAPKFGDKSIWTKKIAAGIDILKNSVYNGKGAMPPKGSCSNCSESELDNALQYMLDAIE